MNAALSRLLPNFELVDDFVILLSVCPIKLPVSHGLSVSKAMNSLVKCAVVLALITFVLLVFVRLIEQSTAEYISRSQLDHKNRLLTELLCDLDHDGIISLKPESKMPVDLAATVSLLSIKAVMKDGRRSAFLLELVTRNGYNGPIRLLLAIRRDGVVLGVRVIEHHETPGLGDKIESGKSSWIDSFIGNSLNSFPVAAWRVKRDGGQFDQFTGATITPRAIVGAIREGLLFVRSHRQQLFPDQVNQLSTVNSQ